MTIEQTNETTLDPLIAALDYVDAWERGEAIECDPEGLAFLQRLQRARIGRLGIKNVVEART